MRNLQPLIKGHKENAMFSRNSCRKISNNLQQTIAKSKTKWYNNNNDCDGYESTSFFKNFRDFFRGFAFHQGFQTPSFVVGCSIRKFLTRAGTTMSNVPLKDKPRPIARALAYFLFICVSGLVASHAGRVENDNMKHMEKGDYNDFFV